MIYRSAGEERVSGGDNRHAVVMCRHAVRIHSDVARCLGPGACNQNGLSSQKL